MTSLLGKNEFGTHLFSACDYHNPELEGRGERRGGQGNMTIRQMGEGGVVLVMGEGDIGVFLSLVWASPDPDTLCGPSSGFTRFPLRGETRGREGRGTRFLQQVGEGEPL